MAPKRLVYVSCDPATLARDIKYLSDKGFKLEKAAVYDQFSHGVHVEVVTLLQLSNRKPDTKVRIDIDLNDYYAIKGKTKTEKKRIKKSNQRHVRKERAAIILLK